MYAVVELNNRQYIVKKDDEIIIDRLNQKEQEEEIHIKSVLLLKDKNKVFIGKPYLNNVTVQADFIKEIKDKKITIFKYKRRKKYRKKQGHRQLYSIIKIKNITIK